MYQYDEYTLAVPWKKNEILGITPNENLIIMNIQKNTLADGLFRIGDKICKVNGINVSNIDELENFFHNLFGTIYITIKRSEERETFLKDQLSFTGEDNCHITKREGFDYFLERLFVTNHKKFGFKLKDFKNRVIISKIKKNKKAGYNIEVGDQICCVNDMPVTDRNEEREVSLIICRPVSDEAMDEVYDILNKKKHLSTSIRMNDDVKEIVRRECERIRQNNIKYVKGILSNGKIEDYYNVSFDTDIQEFEIVSDTEGKRLKKVRKKF